jgi:hypothetical protein
MTDSEHLRRWRLILGSAEGAGAGGSGGAGITLSGDDRTIDEALAALYNTDEQRSGNLGSSSPKVARW